jgi:acyl-CoA synthetase (AMP-forming)/AMP-acid ligase II
MAETFAHAGVQGYGLTETCAGTFVTYPDAPSQYGTVGLPLPGIDLRLEGVPELSYMPDGSPQRGEICVKGDPLFTSYYRQPELTAESFDDEGFFHTGDIGELTPEGALRVIDRKKNIFKLSQGERVGAQCECAMCVSQQKPTPCPPHIPGATIKCTLHFSHPSSSETSSNTISTQGTYHCIKFECTAYG